MKKLLVLLVVLGFVSAASAGVIDIKITSLDGQPIAPVTEITVIQSQIVDLTITYDGLAGRYLFGLSAIVGKSGEGLGTLDLASKVRSSFFDSTLSKIGTVGGQQWIVEGASNTGVPGAGIGQPQVVVSNILLHCDGPGDVIIKLSDYAAGGGSIEVNDSFDMFTPTYGAGVVIHQIPEPMTMMLLGLGSLFLVRRKK